MTVMGSMDLTVLHCQVQVASCLHCKHNHIRHGMLAGFRFGPFLSVLWACLVMQAQRI